MVNPQSKTSQTKPEATRFTAQLSWDAYDALVEIQRQYRKQTGKKLHHWKILDAAVRAYAKEQGIRIGE